MQRADIQTLLSDHRKREQLLDALCEQLQQSEARLYSVAAQQLSAMPAGGQTVQDRTGEHLIAVEEIRKEISELCSRQRSERCYIEQLCKPLSVDQRQIIRLRYVDALSWAECTRLLFGRHGDFERKAASYSRRAYQIHVDAMAALQNKKG